MRDTIKTRLPFLVIVALLAIFFPCGLLYPLQYPAREVVILLIWVCAFPSRLGWLSIVLLPLFRSDTFGYFAFNLFCVIVTLGTGARLAGWVKSNQNLAGRLQKLVRVCMMINLVLAVWQAIDGKDWLNTFPAMQSIGDGRGAGLRPEPSLLAPLLALYLILVIWRRTQLYPEDGKRRVLLLEAAVLSATTLLLTRSFSVAIVVVCFLPAFTKKLRHFVGWLAFGSLLAEIVFWDRVQDAFRNAGSFADLITTSVGSWRNVPDILIVINYQEFLLPTNPADLRAKLDLSALIWNPAFAWLDSTYSTFSASAVTIGLIATCALFVGGLYFGLRIISRSNEIRATWILLYVANWFVMPKYEPCGWAALGILTATFLAAEERLPADLAASAVVSG